MRGIEMLGCSSRINISTFLASSNMPRLGETSAQDALTGQVSRPQLHRLPRAFYGFGVATGEVMRHGDSREEEAVEWITGAHTKTRG
jgi:hypothetical protein